MNKIQWSGLQRLFVAALAISSTAANGAPSQYTKFTGLWQGIDPLDGGRITTSISDIDRDGKYELRSNDTLIRVCQPKEETARAGRGIYAGTGIVNDDGNLVADILITCFGTDIRRGATWTYEPMGNVLKKTGTFFPDNFVIFHRISTH